MRRSIAIAAFSLAACDDVFDIELVPVSRVDAADVSDGASDAFVGPPGLIAHYTMDSIGASGRLEESVAGRDGSCSSCPVPVAGRVGGALTFNGTSDIVSVAPTPAFDTPSGLTVALWFRLETSPTESLCMVSKRLGIDTLNTWQICADPGHALRVYWYQGGEKNIDAGAISEDQWHHVAMRWDGATLSLSVDGTIVIAASAQLSFDGSALTIGADIDGASAAYRWDGALDDLRIYDRALSPAEIQTLATP